MTVFANGVECASLRFAGAVGMINIGGPDQPVACSEPGATLTFLNGVGQLMSVAEVLEPGRAIVFHNFYPQPFDTAAGPLPAVAGANVAVPAAETGGPVGTTVVFLLAAAIAMTLAAYLFPRALQGRR